MATDISKYASKGASIFEHMEAAAQLMLNIGPVDYEDGATTAICRVLRVWEMRKSDLRNTWVDKVLSGDGVRSRSTVVLFQGRIVPKAGAATLHSGIPEPLYEEGSLGAPSKEMDFWIDLHPIFVGLKKKGGGESLKANDYVEVEFNKAYSKASGEWYGVIKSFINLGGASYGSSIDGKISPAAAWKPDVRANAKSLPVSPPPSNVPRRFLFLGDEMFGTSTRLINRSTSFVKKIQGNIRELYSGLRGLHISASPERRTQVLQKLERQFDVPIGLLEKVADKLGDGAGLIPIPDFWNISVAFAGPSFYSKDGIKYYTESHKGNVILDLPNAKLKFNGPKPSGKPTIAQHGVDLLTKTLDTVSPFWSNEVESDTGWDGKFDFAIIGGPMGYGASPGWAAAGGMPSKYEGYAMYGYDGYGQWDFWGRFDLADTPIDHNRIQEWVFQVARLEEEKFIEKKVEFYKSILDSLKGGGIKGTIWVGPALGVDRGRIDISKYRKGFFQYEKVATHVEWDIGGYRAIERHRLRVLPINAVDHQKAGVGYTYSPYFDHAFHYRSATSKAIFDVIKDDDKAYPCLAYCTTDYDLKDMQANERIKYDEVAQHFNVSPSKNNKIKNTDAQEAYANWVIRMLCMYIAEEKPPTGVRDAHVAALKDQYLGEAIKMADFVKDAEFLDRWEADMENAWGEAFVDAENIFGYLDTDDLPKGLQEEIEHFQKISEDLAQQYSTYAKEESDWWWSAGDND